MQLAVDGSSVFDCTESEPGDSGGHFRAACSCRENRGVGPVKRIKDSQVDAVVRQSRAVPSP
jgi:hypothetical protein